MLRAMRRTADALQRPHEERTGSPRAMLSIKRSAICCEQCAGLQTLRSVRIKSGRDRLEPCLALSARRYAASNAKECRRSAASASRADRIASNMCDTMRRRRSVWWSSRMPAGKGPASSQECLPQPYRIFACYRWCAQHLF